MRRGAGWGDDDAGEACGDGACVVSGCGTSSADASWIGEGLADGTGATDGGGAAGLGRAVAAAAGAAAPW
jgi:hypothetical protein